MFFVFHRTNNHHFDFFYLHSIILSLKLIKYALYMTWDRYFYYHKLYPIPIDRPMYRKTFSIPFELTTFSSRQTQTITNLPIRQESEIPHRVPHLPCPRKQRRSRADNDKAICIARARVVATKKKKTQRVYIHRGERRKRDREKKALCCRRRGCRRTAL